MRLVQRFKVWWRARMCGVREARGLELKAKADELALRVAAECGMEVVDTSEWEPTEIYGHIKFYTCRGTYKGAREAQTRWGELMRAEERTGEECAYAMVAFYGDRFEDESIHELAYRLADEAVRAQGGRILSVDRRAGMSGDEHESIVARYATDLSWGAAGKAQDDYDARFLAATDERRHERLEAVTFISGVAQPGEARRIHTPEVAGSNPAPATTREQARSWYTS